MRKNEEVLINNRFSALMCGYLAVPGSFDGAYIIDTPLGHLHIASDFDHKDKAHSINTRFEDHKNKKVHSFCDDLCGPFNTGLNIHSGKFNFTCFDGFEETMFGEFVFFLETLINEVVPA